MDLGQLALASIAISALPVVVYVVLSQRYFREHDLARRDREDTPPQYRTELNPLKLARELPRFTSRRVDALLTHQQDHHLESMRRRSLAAFVVAVLVTFSSIPLVFLVQGVARRIADGRISISRAGGAMTLALLGLGACVLAISWATYSLLVRRERSYIAIAVGLTALVVGGLLLGGLLSGGVIAP